ncbi:hypothetical protein E3N88_16521 [Mikania micrantha]|uniref:Integrase catalytic domain-containing protein n=1 Tax=Mikania micrantha TaxID=192012 RepID=A0A5N6P0B6_9ASTR|nr:hypothetical protein E3N88_16521 [Mikania micrantha]
MSTKNARKDPAWKYGVEHQVPAQGGKSGEASVPSSSSRGVREPMDQFMGSARDNEDGSLPNEIMTPASAKEHRNRSEVFVIFQQFIKMAEQQFNTKIKSVQTDWGGEFRKLSPFLSQLGIIHRLSSPHTSELNGVVECRHRHVVETGLTLLAQSHVPQRFWRFAFGAVVYLINRMPSRSNSNISPFECLFRHKPNYSFLRVFGCQCYPHLRPYDSHKLDFRSVPCVFLGYSTSHHGYRCLDPTTDRLYVSRHVRFNEHAFLFQNSAPPSQPTPPPPYFSTYPSHSTTHLSADTPLQPSSSAENSPAHPLEHPTSLPANTSPFHSSPATTTAPLFPNQPQFASHSSLTSSSSSSTPPSPPPPPPPFRMRPANLRPNPKQPVIYNPSAYHTYLPSDITPTSFTIANKDPHSRTTMADEYKALVRNHTWSLVPRQPHTCGFRQQPGVDYCDTFSPVVKPTTIRVVLSLAVAHGWSLRQLDVQNAFLHGDLKEIVYLQQPPGFVDPQKPDHVCLLHKSLYGLKQAPRAWFQRLSSTLSHLGFRGSKIDPSLFIFSKGRTLLYMLVYVDDIILTGNNSADIDKVVRSLSNTFALQDLGNLSYFLDLLRQAGLSQAKPVPSPMATSTTLTLGDNPPFENPHQYRQMVGALHQTDPLYLQGDINFGLLLHHDSGSMLHAYTDVSLTAYSDSDWAVCPDDQKSTWGFAIYLGKNLVSWAARKQKTVSWPSTESEYKALGDTVAELTWLETLLRELCFPVKQAPTLWCDNLGATYLSANPVFHARTKHVEVDFHFVRERVAQKKLTAQFISTQELQSDLIHDPLIPVIDGKHVTIHPPSEQFTTIQQSEGISDLIGDVEVEDTGRPDSVTSKAAPYHFCYSIGSGLLYVNGLPMLGQT